MAYFGIRIVIVFMITYIMGVADGLYIVPNEKETIANAGGNFSLKCIGNPPLKWLLPRFNDKMIKPPFYSLTRINGSDGTYKIVLNLYNITTNYVGYYYCLTKNLTVDLNTLKILEQKQLAKSIYLYVDDPHKLIINSAEDIFGKNNTETVIPCRPTSPNVHISFLHNGIDIISELEGRKQGIQFKKYDRKVGMYVKIINFKDNTTFNCSAFKNGKREFKIFNLHVISEPQILRMDSYKFIVNGTSQPFLCSASGQPQPKIKWFFTNLIKERMFLSEHVEEKISVGDGKRILISNSTVAPIHSGLATCIVENIAGVINISSEFYITDIEHGFGIYNDHNTSLLLANDNITLICKKSHFYDLPNVAWYRLPENKIIDEKNNDGYLITYEDTDSSHQIILTILNVNKNHSGEYTCKGKDPTDKQRIINEGTKPAVIKLDVKDGEIPVIISSNMNNSKVKFNLGEQNIQMYCNAIGFPIPVIYWYKDRARINCTFNDKERIFSSQNGSILNFKYIKEEDVGLYSCKAYNKIGFSQRYTELILHIKPNYTYKIVGILLIILIIIIIVLVYKVCKARKLKKDLYLSGFKYFQEGAIGNINPDISVDEQAELLPYDKNVEFPREKLKIGKQLGSGAFGVVMKAHARNITKEKEISTVAVKMVKKTADPILTKALISELKIMIHLGKHLNIVNLLGACTKDISNNDFLVIVEYCCFGNIHNYLLRHRYHFINQIDPKSGSVNFAIGADIFNKNITEENSKDYKKNKYENNTPIQSTNNTSNITPTFEMISSNSNNDVQPEWRSNCRGDYNYKKDTKMVSTKDLLSWSYQIAAGLEYLAKRKVLHGDLATRNILLSNNNIIKICDFGLAKRMYKSYNYKKKGNTPLPIKWMAIESIRDRIFSTQSDVWAYGIVLWELFSLACSPYPGMEADEKFYDKLIQGYRMSKPYYCTEEIYKIMLECWRSNPMQRPTFKDLVVKFSQMLDEDTQKYFINMYGLYTNMNRKWLADRGNNDLLATMSSPDYSNFTYLNPKHHYVNGPFGGPFSVNPQSPEEKILDYLPMKPIVSTNNQYETSLNKNDDDTLLREDTFNVDRENYDSNASQKKETAETNNVFDDKNRNENEINTSMCEDLNTISETDVQTNEIEELLHENDQTLPNADCDEVYECSKDDIVEINKYFNDKNSDRYNITNPIYAVSHIFTENQNI